MALALRKSWASYPRNAPCPPRRSPPHRSHGAHLARSPSPALPSPGNTTRENRGQNDTDGSALATHLGQPQDGHRNLGFSRPSSKAACPRMRSPEGPEFQCPDPDGALRLHFHAPNWNLVGEGEGVSHG